MVYIFFYYYCTFFESCQKKRKKIFTLEQTQSNSKWYIIFILPEPPICEQKYQIMLVIETQKEI